MKDEQKSKDTNQSPQPLAFLSFEVVKERWSRYKLSDGSVVKSKFILINILGEKNFQEQVKKSQTEKKEVKLGLQMQSYNVVGVEVSDNMRGPPDHKKYSVQELEASVVENDLDLEIISESWNSYNVAGKVILKIKSTPISIDKTSKFDSQGIPIYIYNFSADIKATPIE